MSMAQVTTTTLIRELTLMDRCDRCGAAAYMRLRPKSGAFGDLLFCAHHGGAHLTAFDMALFDLLDEREALIG